MNTNDVFMARIRIDSCSIRGFKLLRGCGDSPRFLLPDHNLAESLRRKQPGYISHFQRRLESLRGHFAQKRLQPLQASLGDHPTVLKLGFGKRTTRILNDLPARNFDLKRAL